MGDIVLIQSQDDVETIEIARAYLSGALIVDNDTVTGGHGDGPFVRCITSVPTAAAGRVYVEQMVQPSLVGLMAEQALGQR